MNYPVVMEHPIFSPTELDVEPAEIVEALRVQANHAALEEDWDDYSHLIAQLAAALELDKQADVALDEYLWLLYVDLNGPSNIAGMPQALRADFPAFDPELGFIAKDVVEQVLQLMRQLQLEPAEVEARLLNVIELRRLPNMPLDAQQAWVKLAGYFDGTPQDVTSDTPTDDE